MKADELAGGGIAPSWGYLKMNVARAARAPHLWSRHAVVAELAHGRHPSGEGFAALATTDPRQ